MEGETDHYYTVLITTTLVGVPNTNLQHAERNVPVCCLHILNCVYESWYIYVLPSTEPLSSVNARRIKGREKWKRLAQPVISAIDKMLSLAVL